MKINLPSKVIALAGGSGAGKTWLADRLRDELGDDATSLSLDNFYHDFSHLRPAERKRVNFDHPDAIDWPLFQTVLRDLQGGQIVFAPLYDFASHTRLTGLDPRMPRPFIIVEGLWAFWPRHLRALFDVRVFLDCPESLRLERRLERDLRERGRTTDGIQEQFQNVVVPMHARFVEVQRDWADLVIEQPISESDFEELVEVIRDLHSEASPTRLEVVGSRKLKPKLVC